jgi:hypothetical protein
LIEREFANYAAVIPEIERFGEIELPGFSSPPS